jgi:hypothetical protein
MFRSPSKKKGRIVRIINAQNTHHNKFGFIESFYQEKYLVHVQLDGLAFQFNKFIESIRTENGEVDHEHFASESLQVVCSNCMSDDERLLKKCSTCRSVLYCGTLCQKKQWDEHKVVCKALQSVYLKESDSSRDHPSWYRCDKLTKRSLRIMTLDKSPWPLTLETKAMLSAISPSYLTAHPKMLFDFRAPFLMEITSELVPAHIPERMCYVVVGEVSWTEECEQYFDGIFRSTGFQVPPGATALCPGTGKKIKPSATEVHLFVMGLHMATSEDGLVVRGIFPRILTFEGFDRMRGPNAIKYFHRIPWTTPAKSYWLDNSRQLLFANCVDFLQKLDFRDDPCRFCRM